LEEKLEEILPDTPGVVPKIAEFLLGGLQPGMESGLSKDALHAAFVNALRISSANRPLVLAVEDLHLAGPESLELFAYLSRCIPEHQILLVGVYAEDELEEGSQLHELIAQAMAADHAHLLKLAPLPVTATEEIVRVLVGLERTVRQLAWPLHERSEGNPHLVLEFIGHLRTTGDLVESDAVLEFRGTVAELTLPSGVNDLAALKLGRLDEDQRETLEAAAVLGYEFGASLLAAVMEEKRIKLLKRLAGLERKHRLLVSSGKNAFRFASRQLFEAVYEAISPALRIEYHAVVADTLLENREEEEEGEETTGEVAYTLLHHLHHAERALEAEPFLEEALDYMGAHFHATFAVPFLEGVAGALDVARPPARFALLMKLWAFYELQGQRADQLRVLEDARGLAGEMGEPGPLGRVHSCLGATVWYTGRYDRAGEESVRGLELARQAQDRKWEANSLHTLGLSAWRQGKIGRAAECWREALEIRREIDDRRGVASSLMGLAAIMPQLGEGEKSVETKQEALEMFRDIGDRRGEAGVLVNLGVSLTDAYRYEEALSRLDAAAQICRELGDHATESIALMNLGRAHKILGRIEQAKESWERALDICREAGDANGEIKVHILYGPAVQAYGELDAARTHIEAAIELAGKTGGKTQLVEAHRYLGNLLHRTGKRDESRKEYERSLELADEIGSKGARYRTLAAMGDAALQEEKYDRAVELLSEALELVGGPAHGSLLPLCKLARALLGEGEQERARELARMAAAILEEGGAVSPEDRPEIYFRLYEVLGDEASAKRYLTSAREALDRRTATLTHAAYKEHFLTQTGANPEILEVARQVLGS
jgi:tetratricopeptide (TPR) repeat protein